jgi:hypothetical protein
LNNLYIVTRALATEASIHSSREKFLELISMFARLRAAWTQVERTVGFAEPNQRLRICSSTPASPPKNDPPPEHSNSSGGGWNA